MHFQLLGIVSVITTLMLVLMQNHLHFVVSCHFGVVLYLTYHLELLFRTECSHNSCCPNTLARSQVKGQILGHTAHTLGHQFFVVFVYFGSDTPQYRIARVFEKRYTTVGLDTSTSLDSPGELVAYPGVQVYSRE